MVPEKGRIAGRRLARTAVVGFAWMTLAWSTAAFGSPDSVARSSDAHWNSLQHDLQRLQQRHGVPRLVLVILDRGRPAVVSARGHDGTAADIAAPFRWGSISKTVTALVLLEAARVREVSPATAVAELLPSVPYRNPWAKQSPVRVEHLLELSAGLPDLTSAEFDDNTPRPLGEALKRGARDRVLLWPPGLQHSYSNVVPGISAAVVEHLTGQDFSSAAAALVFEPVGMAGASYQPVSGLPGGFRADGRTEIPYWHMTFPAFGALNASPLAMARLAEALLNGGRVSGRQVLHPDSVARTYRVESTLGARHGLEIGYGAGLYGWVHDGHLFFGHGGDADGYRSRLGLLPASGRGYLIGINVDDPSLLRNMVRRIEAALTADLPAAEPPEPALVSDLTRYAGDYYPSSARFGVSRWRAGDARPARIEVSRDALVFVRGRRQRLLPLGDGRFRRVGDPAASVVFGERGGNLFMQGELGNFVRLAGPCVGFLPVCRQREAQAGDSPDME